MHPHAIMFGKKRNKWEETLECVGIFFSLNKGKSLTTNLVVLNSYMPTTSTKKINMAIYFENSTVGLHIFYVSNMYCQILSNWM